MATSDITRNVLNGDDLAAYQVQRAAAKDPIAFDALRMVRNGWTAAKERSYQKHAGLCHITIQDGPALIAALEAAVAIKQNEDERAVEARRTLERVTKENPIAQPLPVMPGEDIVFDTSAPLISDDDIQFRK